MRRKLIKQGIGGYTIYLPKKWVDRKGLKEGGEVDIAETDAGLIVGSVKEGKKEITIELDDEKRRDIKNILTHLYRKGFDSITLKSMNDLTFKEVKKVADMLLGFEITEKDKRSCKIENISEPTEQKYDMLLRKIFLIIQENIEVLIKSFEKNKFDDWKDVEDMRKQLDSYILFCRRIIIKEKYDKDSLLGWELLTFLMHIQHALYYFYKYLKENKVKKTGKIDLFLGELKNYFDLYSQAYLKKDMRAIHKINSLKHKHHFGELIDLIEMSEKKEAMVFAYFREVFRLIQIGSSPVLSELVEKEIKKD